MAFFATNAISRIIPNLENRLKVLPVAHRPRNAPMGANEMENMMANGRSKSS